MATKMIKLDVLGIVNQIAGWGLNHDYDDGYEAKRDHVDSKDIEDESDEAV